jgi:hypothetical protein
MAERMKEKCVPLEFFYWRRIILDEGHEVVCDDEFLHAINCLRGNFKWYITGIFGFFRFSSSSSSFVSLLLSFLFFFN